LPLQDEMQSSTVMLSNGPKVSNGSVLGSWIWSS
jgi:hypothetical protein